MRTIRSTHGKRVLTFILAGGRGERLYPLTKERSKPSVPFAGEFRVIDFVLSNCINSELRQIFLLTQTKSQSLDNHLRYGWNFLAQTLGEFILPVPAQQRIGERWYLGSADAIFQNLNIVEEYRPDLVLVLSGDHIYRMNYRDMVRYHLEAGGQLTLPVIAMPKSEAKAFGVLASEPDGRIVKFVEKPQSLEEIPGEGDHCNVNMGIYLFDTEALVREVVRDAQTDSAHDFGRNVIPHMIGEYRVYGMPFKDNTLGGYWRDIGTIDSYYQASMDLLTESQVSILTGNGWPIFPVGRTGRPTRFHSRAPSRVINSLVSSGCDLEECTVVNSILSPGVAIGEGSEVENSIVFDDSIIERGVHIRNAIIDKNVHIHAGTTLGLDSKRDRQHFVVSPGGIVVIPKNHQY